MIKFNEEELDNYLKHDQDMIKSIFEDKELFKYLDNDDFDRLYERVYNNNCRYTQRTTAVLLKSDIDFLPYLTKIPADCFCHIPITEIEIPDNIISIGRDAFWACERLTSIKIPNSVTSIDDSAFYGCKKLKKIKYLGTKEQWENTTKGMRYYSIKQIVCSDGVIDVKIDDR